MSLVKFVKGDTTSLNSTYRRQGTGNIEFDVTTKKIYLDGVNYTGEVDSELTQKSNNPVSSSALYEVITQNELTTAAALTEHEDRLDGLDETVAGKQDALTFDTTPTANSTNPVTSGGVKTALDAKQNTLVSGTNIKTINDQSLLGSGNLDLNPLIFITFWQTDRPALPSSGQYWYNSQDDRLQVYDGSDWTSVTLSQQKLYIRLTTNEIYRYDRAMIRMTLDPTSIVTT